MQIIEQKQLRATRSGAAKWWAEYVTLSNAPNASSVLDDSRDILQELREWHASSSPMQRRRRLIGAIAAGAVVATIAKYGHEFTVLSGRRPPLSTLSNRPKGSVWSVFKAIKKFIGPGFIDTRTCVHLATVGLDAIRSDAYKQRRLSARALTLGLLAVNTLYTVEPSEAAPMSSKNIILEAGSDLAYPAYALNEVGVSVDVPTAQFTPTTIPEAIGVSHQALPIR